MKEVAKEYDLLKDEVITTDNVERRGIAIALKALKTVLSHSYNRRLDKLYFGLVKDVENINNPDHIFSDGYDLAQEASCFLCAYTGKSIYDNCAYDVKGRLTTILKACFSRVNQMIMRERKDSFVLASPECPEVINLSVPFTIQPTIEETEEQRNNVLSLIQRMKLTKLQYDTLMCFLNGMTFTEIARYFGIQDCSLCGRRYAIQKHYIKYIGVL